jgi:hypothetical protein
VILDDTSRVSAVHQDRVSDIVYLVCNGRGRSRGAVQGAAQTDTFRTALLSSGEAPLRSFCTGKGGVVMRTLELEGVPFGRKDKETEKSVKALDQGVRTNYGHAGPAVVAWLLKNRDRWDELRKTYREREAHYRKEAAGDEGLRLASYVAALDVAAQVAREALGLDWIPKNPVETLWQNLCDGSRDPTGAEKALQLVFSWAEANEGRFFSRGTACSQVIGRWDTGSAWKFIAFYPHALEEFLRKEGFTPDAILKAWDARGWLVRSEPDRLQANVRIGGKGPERLYKVSREAFLELGLCEPFPIVAPPGNATGNTDDTC